MNDAIFDCFYSDWSSLNVIIWVVLGIQWLLIGIIGTYTRKIYREVNKSRPLCIVEGTESSEQPSCEKNHLSPDWWKEVSYLTRYAGSGLINSLAGFVVIFSAMALGFTPMASNVAGYAFGFTLGFVLSKKFVFRSNGHFVAESVRYLVAFVISFVFNLLVLRFALIYLNFHAVASQVLAAIAYTLLMYILTRLFVFRHR